MVQNGELKRQVLAWLKAKRAELQSQARFAQPEQQPRGAVSFHLELLRVRFACLNTTSGYGSYWGCAAL